MRPLAIYDFCMKKPSTPESDLEKLKKFGKLGVTIMGHKRSNKFKLVYTLPLESRRRAPEFKPEFKKEYAFAYDQSLQNPSEENFSPKDLFYIRSLGQELAKEAYIHLLEAHVEPKDVDPLEVIAFVPPENGDSDWIMWESHVLFTQAVKRAYLAEFARLHTDNLWPEEAKERKKFSEKPVEVDAMEIRIIKDETRRRLLLHYNGTLLTRDFESFIDLTRYLFTFKSRLPRNSLVRDGVKDGKLIRFPA